MIKALTVLGSILMLAASHTSAYAAQSAIHTTSCIGCHGNAILMKELGFPHFSVSAELSRLQTGMTATCTDCHMGDPNATDQKQAHTGMARLRIVRKKGLVAETVIRPFPMEIGSNPQFRLMHVTAKEGRPMIDPTVSMLIYHDKKLDTLSQDFKVMEQTCGKCHMKHFSEFRQSAMGKNSKQSAYKSWTDKERGPHNCGVWFDGNEQAIIRGTDLPFTTEQSQLGQRSCNQCHVGCLDCHYLPQKSDKSKPKQGMHTFVKRPPPESCYGGGRGTICHAGPEERRRGAGYFGGTYSYPEGATPDIHLTKNVVCLDCHEQSSTDTSLGHASIKRQANCLPCHNLQQMSNMLTVHRSLTCEACHIQNAGGYQGTFWGPGFLAGSATPFFKYKEYYGVMKEPILIRDQRGRWIPVKPYPMAVLNQKSSDLTPGLHWRWPKNLPDLSRTDDAWGYVGLFSDLPENNQALLWVQMDKLSHKYGPSRPCASCHELQEGEQRQSVSWEFSDTGAQPFSGSHTVVGNRKGLFITGIKAGDAIEIIDGYRLSSFAPWFFWPERWAVSGDFSIPRLKDQKGYDSAKVSLSQARQIKVLHQ